MSQECLKNKLGNPSGPRAFRDPMESRVAYISSSEGMDMRSVLSDLEITEVMRPARSGEVATSAVRISLKCSTRINIISCLSSTQDASLFFRVDMLFLCLRQIAVAWKNFVLRSPSLI